MSKNYNNDKDDLFGTGYNIACSIIKEHFTNEMAYNLRKHIYDNVSLTLKFLSDNEKKEFYRGIDIGIINTILDKLSFSS